MNEISVALKLKKSKMFIPVMHKETHAAQAEIVVCKDEIAEMEVLEEEIKIDMDGWIVGVFK